MNKALTLVAAAAALALSAGAALAQTIAVTNGRVLTGTGEIARGTVVIQNGRISAVGADVAVPSGAQVIDAQGGVIAPGFVAVDSGLGGVEVSALADTRPSTSPGVWIPTASSSR